MGCGCRQTIDAEGQRRVLSIALALNASMFAVGLVAGLIAQSSGLLADSLDMLADAAAYAMALCAVDRSNLFKARAARLSGGFLLLLGTGVFLDALRRGVLGSSPNSLIMGVVAAVSLAVNATVLCLLRTYRDQEAHLRATWIFTRADVVANLAVIASGGLIWLTGLHWIDAIVGAAIGVYVIKEALEILRDERARQERTTIH